MTLEWVLIIVWALLAVMFLLVVGGAWVLRGHDEDLSRDQRARRDRRDDGKNRLHKIYASPEEESVLPDEHPDP